MGFFPLMLCYIIMPETTNHHLKYLQYENFILQNNKLVEVTSGSSKTSYGQTAVTFTISMTWQGQRVLSTHPCHP